MLDVRIRGGLVYDGTGGEPVRTDIAIAGDTITDLADLSRAEARHTVDATGRIVCPGFIDVHTHSDTYLLIEPLSPSKIYQGITTEVTGNCGASGAPVGGDYRLPSDWRDKVYPGTWHSVAEFRELLEEARPAVNVVMLIGHGNLRGALIGYEDKPATAEQCAEMERRLRSALEEGGHGLSTGLIYPPGLYAGREELVSLARVVAQYDGIYTTHMASESDRLLECIEATIALAKDAPVRAQVSHLKTAGRSNWPLVGDALALIRDAREEGVDIAADRYPYVHGATELDVVFPAWAEEGGTEAVMARLHDPATRDRIRAELRDSRPASAWESVMVGSTVHPENARFRGATITQVAGELGVQPEDAILLLTQRDQLRTGAFFGGMSEENMRTILAEPYVMLGSDASLRAPGGPLGSDYPHPRAYGTFPRFLRMALEGETVPLAEAIRKMTSLPADHFRLARRGRLAKGNRADVVVLDPATVRDRATYADPHQFAEGIETVLVNGALTIEDGRPTGVRAGQIL